MYKKNKPLIIFTIIFVLLTIAATVLPFWRYNYNSNYWVPGRYIGGYYVSGHWASGISSSTYFMFSDESAIIWGIFMIQFAIIILIISLLLYGAKKLTVKSKKQYSDARIILIVFTALVSLIFLISSFVIRNDSVFYCHFTALYYIFFPLYYGTAIAMIVMAFLPAYKRVFVEEASQSEQITINETHDENTDELQPENKNESYQYTNNNFETQQGDNMEGKVYANLEGAQKVLDVYEDRVELTQIKNARAFLTRNLLKGNKSIAFSSMTSVQFKEGTKFLLGYIQFETASSFGGDNYGSENSWTFEMSKNDIAKEVCEYCRKKIKEVQTKANVVYAQPQQVSGADEIIKYKKLLDDGIITQEEFDKKKKEILERM